jgi:RyR domain-containing protein
VSYDPKTIDTSQVRLSPAVGELVERLARNNHDHWARKRIEEGWRCGPRRDDHLKEHPDLVPYEQLSESEKDYDRKTVIEAIKAIVALGYEIRKKV